MRPHHWSAPTHRETCLWPCFIISSVAMSWQSGWCLSFRKEHISLDFISFSGINPVCYLNLGRVLLKPEIKLTYKLRPLLLSLNCSFGVCSGTAKNKSGVAAAMSALTCPLCSSWNKHVWIHFSLRSWMFTTVSSVPKQNTVVILYLQ